MGIFESKGLYIIGVSIRTYDNSAGAPSYIYIYINLNAVLLKVSLHRRVAGPS